MGATAFAPHPLDLHGEFPHLAKWLAGTEEPTLAQLEQFAIVTHAPLGYLFLREPPVEEFPLTDFRQSRDGAPVVSTDLRDQIYDCQRKQDWYVDYALGQGLDPVSVVGELSVETTHERAAELMMERLGIREGRFETFVGQQAAVSNFAEKIENLGILVMISDVVGNDTRRVLNPQEFSGFSFSHELAPLIIVNGAGATTAQMFTLAHELAHIFLGDTSVSTASPEQQDGAEHEVWCNQVATELLMPAYRVMELTCAKGVSYEFLTAIAAGLKVSPLALLASWYEFDFVGEAQFQELRGRCELELSKTVKTKLRSSGSIYITAPARSGKRLTRAVLSSTMEGETSFTEAFEILGAKNAEDLQELARRLGVSSPSA